MASDFERAAVQRVIDQAEAAGVDVPENIRAIVSMPASIGGAVLWMKAHPDFEGAGCCYGDAIYGPERCTCWKPVFDVDQADPVPPGGPEDICIRSRMCGDCAYRPGSPERSEEFLAERLLSMPEEGKAFYCHDGMRRPVRWEHPDGRAIDGSPDDWQPAIVNGIPYRANGKPGLLCAGWAARGRRATHLQEKES